jgi:hypothetical protein
MLNNTNIRKYTQYNFDGTINVQYVREPNQKDTPAVYDDKGNIVSLPVFYGKWIETPQCEIDKLNEQIKLNKFSNGAKRPAKQLSEREKFENQHREDLKEQLRILTEELARRKGEAL